MNQVVIHDLNDIMNAIILFETNISVYLDGKSSVTIIFCLFFFFVLGGIKKRNVLKENYF